MASTCKFFDEDAVYKINSKKKRIDVGLVLENAEYLSSDEDEEDELDYTDWERMKKGHIRVAWHPNGSEEVLPEKRVKLCDRSLMPGDVVRRIIKGKDTQYGYCRFTSVKADIQVVGTKQVLIGVESSELKPLEEYMVDVAVFKDSWVGMLKTIKSELTLRCYDGSRCVMSDVDAFDMEDVLDSRKRSSEFKKYNFYKGQLLWGPTYCFHKVKWLNLNPALSEVIACPSKSVRATVEDVKVISLGVQWVCKAYSEDSIKTLTAEQPKYHVTGDDLKDIKMMNIFESSTLQIGDRNFLVMREGLQVTSLHEWKQRMTNRLYSEAIQKQKNPSGPCALDNETKEEEEADCDVEDNNSEYEDIDEDGTEKDGARDSDSMSVTSSLSSTASSDTNSMNSRKKKKGHTYVIKKKIRGVRGKALRNVMKKALPLAPGQKLVTEALITETKAHVIWQDGTLEQNIPSTSLYPVHHLDGHEFFPGDYVVDNRETKPYEYGVVKNVDHSGRTALVTWMKTYHAGGDPHPEYISEQEVSVYDIKDHPDFKYRPGACVIRVVNPDDPGSVAGQVVDVHANGRVEVSWVNGKSTLCYPQELYHVGEYVCCHKDSDDLWADDESLSDESWETESEKSLVGNDELSSTDDNTLDKIMRSAEKEIDGAAKDLEKFTLKMEDKEEDAKSAEDMQGEIHEKLLANIEKLRAGMARLEEVFTQNPTLQTCNVMRRLLELYKHCKVLDQLLGTTYFHERHLQSLVERLKHRGRVNSIQHMADQIFRLFPPSDATNNDDKDASPNDDKTNNSEQQPNKEPDIDILIQSPTEAPNINDYNLTVVGSSPTTETNNDLNAKEGSPVTAEAPITNLYSKDESRKPLLSPLSPTGGGGNSEPRNLCQQLCSILKSRLLKAHEDAEQRFGMPRSKTSALLAGEASQSNSDEAKDEKDDDGEQKMEMDLKAEEDAEVNTAGQSVFSLVESVPDNHKYKLSIFQPVDPCAFFRIVKKEMKLLKTSLPDGIIVKSFEDRIDLYSVLIKGPQRTPYEDGVFIFDFQLPADYPKVPPLCHYVSYCSDRLNPNLYEGGKVCVSLLGTWGGKGTEMWNAETSNLLQVIVSIQGLILVSEPYYNEAGYERQKGTQLGMENSRMYNEMVVLKLVQAMSKLLLSPPAVFKDEITEHFQANSSNLIKRMEKWLEVSESWNTQHPTSPTSPTTFKDILEKSDATAAQVIALPEFPLIPASKGFCLTLRKSLADFKKILLEVGSIQNGLHTNS